jgi:polar amino acid transport system substrate-binding protein
MRGRVAVLSIAGAAVLAAAGCAAKSDPAPNASTPVSAGATSAPAAGGSPAAAACPAGDLPTHSSGTLTVATDSPAYEPWFSDDKPTNGKGFESAVAYAVAMQLGYPAAEVKWVVAPFTSVVAPTPKQYDFDINEVSITAKRAKVVDFSTGYYDVAQAVVALKSDKYADATSIAGLKGAKLGAQQGTTSFDAINDDIKPGTGVSEYPTNNLAVQALKNGQIDGLVVDLPTGLYLTSAELTGAKIIGQLPVSGSPEQFGLVLEHGSKLTSCVSTAVDALRKDGTLAALQKKWLTSTAGAPELK